MSLALLALALLPQLHGSEGDEPRAFLWPLGSGYAPYELLTTYGQPNDKARRLHAGLDVSDRSRLTGTHTRSVYALEDGRVVWVFLDPVNYQSGVVVASHSVPGRAWLYLHLETSSIRFAEGDEVSVNQILGELLLDDPVTGVEHVHLSRLGGKFERPEDGTDVGWGSLPEQSERNPLALLKPAALGDLARPSVEVIDDESLHFRPDESSPSSDPIPRTAIPAAMGPVDALACVHDGDGGPHPLAPYKLQLTVQDDPSQTFHLCLDGPLPAPEVICRRMKLATGEYRVFFVLTNGALACGSSPAPTNAWRATAGPHTLELSLEDVSGLATKVEVVTEAH